MQATTSFDKFVEQQMQNTNFAKEYKKAMQEIQTIDDFVYSIKNHPQRQQLLLDFSKEHNLSPEQIENIQVALDII